MTWWPLIASLVVFLIFTIYLQIVLKDKDKATNQLVELDGSVRQIINQIENIERSLNNLEIAKQHLDSTRTKIRSELNKERDSLQATKNDLDEIIKQRSDGFPLIAKLYRDYFNMKSKIQTDKLKYKERPALKAAEAIKSSNQEKRKLVTMIKVLEMKINNYEDIAPFLKEAVEESMPTVEDLHNFSAYTDEERDDEVTRFVTKDEYKTLSIVEKNQLALDRYFQRRKKSPWAIGKMYEHYVGYLYEAMGWDVEYYGINKRKEDMGRDLIAKKDGKCHIVQCKHWSKYKTVFENEIFQLFGTTYEYKKLNSSLDVKPVFYTSTKLSDKALDIANLLEIEVKQEQKLEEYPAIKCNVNITNKTKIYHLPFDQQYDSTKIITKEGDFYCMSVAEAEEKGFRRAFKWKGNEAHAKH